MIYKNLKYNTIMKTDRLTLRELQNSDIDELYELIFNDEDVVKHTFGKNKIAYDDIFQYIQKIGLQVIEKNDTKELVGLGGVLACNYLDKEEYEFGFILAKKFWAKGYASEIGKAQIRQIKDELKQPRAIAVVDPQNSASIKCIKRLGLSLVKTVQSDRGERLVYAINFMIK